MHIFFISFLFIINFLNASSLDKQKLIYMSPDMSAPFWNIMSEGIKEQAEKLNYDFEIYDAKTEIKLELENIIKAIKNKTTGIIISPTNSSTCVTILKLAKEANIPVVISDIGTDSGEFISFISSDNEQGAYDIGNILAKKMKELQWQDKTVGIIAISQKRLNGQERTKGFIKALSENNIKGADLKQQISWSEEETYMNTKDMINKHKNLGAIWLQTSNSYNAAQKAIEDSGKKDEILLITFDAEPIFLDLIPQGIILGSAMQQPYLMGQKAVESMNDYLKGKEIKKNIQLEVLPVSTNNIKENLPIIKKNVLGILN
jgi:ribose transport system substrate-binding protein